MVTIQADEKTPIRLGRVGENEVTQVQFDLSELIKDYGDGTVTLMAKRSQDTDAYPVATTRNNTKMSWLVTSGDTAYKGQGKCELFWYVGNALAKSIVFVTIVEPDIGGVGEEPPQPYEPWIKALEDEMDEKIGTAQQAVTDAKGYADAAAASAQEAQTILASTVYIGNDGNFYIRGN